MIRSLAIPFGAGLLLLVCSTIIEKFAISSDGLDRNGNELIVCSFARLGLALLIAQMANRLMTALRDFAAEQWGEPIAREMWNLRLSEDIQSQDFGWLYERNRARYSSRQQPKDAR